MSCTRNTSVYLMNLFEVGYNDKLWYPQGMLGLFCRGILSDIQLYDFVVCLFEQNNIWGNWSIIKFQQGKGITPSQQKNLTNEMLVFVLLL